jgi:hypothetical protein
MARTKEQDRDYQRVRYSENEVAREKRKTSARAYAARIRATRSEGAPSETPNEVYQI